MTKIVEQVSLLRHLLLVLLIGDEESMFFLAPVLRMKLLNIFVSMLTVLNILLAKLILLVVSTMIIDPADLESMVVVGLVLSMVCRVLSWVKFPCGMVFNTLVSMLTVLINTLLAKLILPVVSTVIDPADLELMVVVVLVLSMICRVLSWLTFPCSVILNTLASMLTGIFSFSDDK